MPVLKNARHERFAQEVFSGKSASEAYSLAGYRPSRSCASQLRTNPNISARIAELAESAASAKVMTAQQVLEELSNLARSNMQDYMTVGPDGLPRLDWSALSREQAAALAEVTVDQVHQMSGDGEEALPPVNKVKFKLASKLNALELLGKHHALYIERVEVVDSIAERLSAARKRTDGKSRKA